MDRRGTTWLADGLADGLVNGLANGLALLTVAVLLPLAPARAGVDTLTVDPYPDPAAAVERARAAAADGSAVHQWALAEALLGVHRFGDSDAAFKKAARLAIADPALGTDDLAALAHRLRQRMLLGPAIDVLERRVDRLLDGVPAPDDADARLLTRAERERAAQALGDLASIADLHRRQLAWQPFHAARERMLRVAPADRRADELTDYLDLLLAMDDTARALDVARRYVDLAGDVEVLQRCIRVMIRERQQTEAHRMLRLAVASEMDYWDVRSLLNEFVEAFDPGVRWASDRDARLRALLLGKPADPVDQLLLGSAFHAVGDRDAEEQAYRDYLETGGVSAAKLRIVADLLYGMGETAEAFLLYQRFLAEYPAHELEGDVLLRVVDCLERTYDLETSFHGAFNAFGYLFLDERTPQLPVGVFSVLFNDLPLDRRAEQLEDALDRYYVDLLAVDLLWHLADALPHGTSPPDVLTDTPVRWADADAIRAAHRRLLDYYRRYEDDERQLEICERFVDLFADHPDANDVRFEQAAIHHRRGEHAREEQAYRDVFEATVPPVGAPRPYEPLDEDEVTRARQHERALRSLLSLYDRDRVARFYDVVALYKLEIDLRGGELALVDELVRICDQHSAYGEIETLYQEVIDSYQTMAVYDRLARHYLRMRRTREAEQVYRAARERFAADAEPYRWLSNFYTEESRWDDAEGVLRDAIETFPDDLDWYLSLASVRYHSGAAAARCEVYRQALDRFPHEWRFVQPLLACETDLEAKLALAEREQAHLPQARDFLFTEYGRHYLYVSRLEQAEQALQTAPDDPVLHRFVGDLYHALSAFEQALAHYEIAAATMTDDAALLARVADLQRSFGRHAAAAANYTLVAEMRREGWASTSTAPYASAAAGLVPPRRAQDRSYWVTAGEAYAEGGDAAAALRAWRRDLDVDRADEDRWLEVAAACWDYFLFDDAIAVLREARNTLDDDHLHAKQLAAVHESKRDYRAAIDEYVTILADGDAMVREDVRIRLVYLARHKALDKPIRKAFERALKGRPDHEGLYRNYADFAARLEDWPTVYAVYDRARAQVRDRRFLEWVAGEFERLEQLDRAEDAFADLAGSYPADASAWHAYLGYVGRRYPGADGELARIAVLVDAHWAMPTAGFHRQLLPLLEARGDAAGIDRALDVRATALDGADRLMALDELAQHRVAQGDARGAEAVFARQRALGLRRIDHPASWAALPALQRAMLAGGLAGLAADHVDALGASLPIEHASVPTWVAIAAAWHGAGRSDRVLLDAIQQVAPYQLEVASMIADELLADGDEAGMVEMYEQAARAVGGLQDTDDALRDWRPTLSPAHADVDPLLHGLTLDRPLYGLPGYDHNPFGEYLAAGDAGWYRGGHGDGDYGYGDYGYEGYDYGYDGGYAYHGGYEYDGGHAYHDGPHGDPGSANVRTPAERGRETRVRMRRELRRALVDRLVERGMTYDGVTAYERMVNDDPRDVALLEEAWRFAALHGHGPAFVGYYTDVQADAHRDFRWYRVMAELAGFQGDHAGRADWLEKLLLVEPHRADVHRELVTLYTRLGRHDAALEHLDRIGFLTDDPVGQLRDSAAIAYAAGDAALARAHLRKAGERAGDSSTVRAIADELAAHGDHDVAVDVCRGFLTRVTAEHPEWEWVRREAHDALVRAHLHGGDLDGARDAWWDAYAALEVTQADTFDAIYGAPGMLPALRREFESRQEAVITDRDLRVRFDALFDARHLVREQAALDTLMLDVELLALAQRVARTLDGEYVDPEHVPPSSVMRQLRALQAPDHRAVHRKIAWRPSGAPPGDLGAAHAEAIRALLVWEHGRDDAHRGGQVSRHGDVQRYASRFDRGHRDLGRFYTQRHLYLDAAAELRRVELLLGPLYNDVYREQLDLLAAQQASGIDVQRAQRERVRVLGAALDAAVTEAQGWSYGWWTAHGATAQVDRSALMRYLRVTAIAGDDVFAERALGHLDAFAGLAADDGPRRLSDADALQVLRDVNRAVSAAPLPTAIELHRRTMAMRPGEIDLQADYLQLLASRADDTTLAAAIDALIEQHGRLWIYRVGVDHWRSEGEPQRALALCERALERFPNDVDSRLKHIELLAELDRWDRAAAAIRSLVGDQTVGGYLEGERIYASTSFDAPQDQIRTALANHTVHALTASERERLFALWATATGDEALLAYRIERHPRSATAYEQMARMALAGGHTELALTQLARASALFPEDPARYWGLRGAIEWEAGDRDAARATWRALASQPYPEAATEAFDLLWERGLADDAVALAVDEVRSRGYDTTGNGVGASIVAHAVARLGQARDHDRMAVLYRGLVPALDNPWTVANLAAHLRRVHRPEQAERFLDEVLARLDDAEQRSVLFSVASLAHQQGRWAREAEVLATLAGLEPDEPRWPAMRVQALVSAGRAEAVGEAIAVLQGQAAREAWQVPLTADLLRLLARSELPIDGAAADRIEALLADELLDAHRDGALLGPRVELQLSAGRAPAALALLEPTLGAHPASTGLWAAAVDTLDGGGGTVEACSLRQRQADHLLTYLPADDGALLLKARSLVCQGARDEGLATAAEAQRRNPGRDDVVLARARLLLAIDEPVAARAVAGEVAGIGAVAQEAALLRADAALAAGDGAGVVDELLPGYRAALDDPLASPRREALERWARTAEQPPARAAALAPALASLGERRRGDPRPDRLAAALFSASGDPAAAERSLRRALERDPHDPGSHVALLDLLLAPATPADGVLAEARAGVETLYHLDPGRCDAGRLGFRVAAAAGDDDAVPRARGVAELACAGAVDLRRAEQVLVAAERWEEAIAAVERLIAIDVDGADEHRARRDAHVAAFEAAAREEVER